MRAAGRSSPWIERIGKIAMATQRNWISCSSFFPSRRNFKSPALARFDLIHGRCTSKSCWGKKLSTLLDDLFDLVLIFKTRANLKPFSPFFLVYSCSFSASQTTPPKHACRNGCARPLSAPPLSLVRWPVAGDGGHWTGKLLTAVACVK